MPIVAVDNYPNYGPREMATLGPSSKQLTGSSLRISDTDDLDEVGVWIEFLAAGTVVLVGRDDPNTNGVPRTVAAKDWVYLRVRRIKATGTSLTTSQVVVHCP